jgi:5-methylcytosine-specific restriction endonuclease McrA
MNNRDFITKDNFHNPAIYKRLKEKREERRNELIFAELFANVPEEKVVSGIKFTNSELLMELDKFVIGLGRFPKYNEVRNKLVAINVSINTLMSVFRNMKHMEYVYTEWLNNGKPEDNTTTTRRKFTQEQKNFMFKHISSCELCGSSENLELDHFIPWSLGGNTTLENCMVLCKSCNMDKYNKLPITKTEAIIAIEEFEKEFNNLNKLN